MKAKRYYYNNNNQLKYRYLDVSGVFLEKEGEGSSQSSSKKQAQKLEYDADETTSEILGNLIKNLEGAEHKELKELYVVGEFVLQDKFALAAVGSRKISVYGRDSAEYILRPVANTGLTIVSGLMYGADCVAHQSALNAGGRTIGVLGYGFNHLKRNKYALNLANRIIHSNSGVIISEYPPVYPPDKYTFLDRNRIVAGLSQATLIIEGAQASGSMRTADLTTEQGGKPVFVIPGPIFYENSKGKHKLIKEGAYLVDSAGDILSHFGIQFEEQKRSVDINKLEGTSRKIISALLLTEKGLFADEIWLILKQVSRSKLNTHLTNLELEGLITKSFDGRYRLLY